MKKQNTFLFNTAWRDALAEYPPDVRLEVYEATIDYATTGELRELKPLAQMAFSFIRREIDFYQAQYQARRDKQSQAAHGRWAQRRAAEDAATETIAGPSRARSAACEPVEAKPKAPMARVSPPTLDEVKVFFAEQNYKSPPEDFYYYYEKTGWLVGQSKTEIKNWKAAATQWERRQPQFERRNESNNSKSGQPSDEDFRHHIASMLSDGEGG